MRQALGFGFALVLAGAGCASDLCGQTVWDRFRASLEQLPTPASCFEWPEPPESPPQALTGDGDGEDVCASAAGDSSCLACVKAECCAEVIACLAGADCACLLTCRADGGTIETCSAKTQCGAAPDVTSETASACIADRCSCPRFW